MIEKIVTRLTPSLCLVCQRSDGLICRWCRDDAISPLHPVCYSCRARSDDCSTCANCLRAKTRPRYLWAVSTYEGFSKKLIHKMKFAATREAADIIAEYLDEVIPYLEFDTITYVPAATDRLRQRGYDHTKRIAKSLSRRRNLPLKALLVRVVNTRQVGASKTERLRQATRSFRYNPQMSAPRSVLLIDDMLTSGATIEAATRVLKRAGVKEVAVAVFARHL